MEKNDHLYLFFLDGEFQSSLALLPIITVIWINLHCNEIYMYTEYITTEC